MILVPDDIRARLLANGGDRDADHMPVLKLFNPLGSDRFTESGRAVAPADPDPTAGISPGDG